MVVSDSEQTDSTISIDSVLDNKNRCNGHLVG